MADNPITVAIANQRFRNDLELGINSLGIAQLIFDTAVYENVQVNGNLSDKLKRVTKRIGNAFRKLNDIVTGEQVSELPAIESVRRSLEQVLRSVTLADEDLENYGRLVAKVQEAQPQVLLFLSWAIEEINHALTNVLELQTLVQGNEDDAQLDFQIMEDRVEQFR